MNCTLQRLLHSVTVKRPQHLFFLQIIVPDPEMSSTSPHPTICHSTILHHTPKYFIALYCTTLHCTTLSCIKLHHSALYYISPNCTVYTTLNSTAPYYSKICSTLKDNTLELRPTVSIFTSLQCTRDGKGEGRRPCHLINANLCL